MSTKSNWGRILLTGASFAALGATPALAQDTSEEIVVTATGRAAAIQDVPIAVTALSGEQLENAGVVDIKDLSQVVPSYRFYTGQSNTSSTHANIRGIGTGADNPGFEGAVGIFIDGVYRSRAATALSDLPDVERIEILRGPQGTLFGRNTSSGAVSIVTKAPEFETHAWLEGTLGDLELAGTKFGLNTALSETVAVRVDGSLRVRDGYIDDLRNNQTINNQDRWSARGQMLWDITPNASARFIIDAASLDERCCAAITVQRGSIGAAMNGLLAATAPGVAVGVLPGRAGLGPVGSPQSFTTTALNDPEGRDTSVTPGRAPREQVDEIGVSGQFDWDLGNDMDFTSITAYRDWNSDRDQDIDFSDLDRAYRDGLKIQFQTFTQEVRLHGQRGRLDWLLGGFYAHEEMNTTDTIRVGTQAAAFVDAITAGANLSTLGAPDINGAAPGSGYQVYNTTNPGATPTFLNVAFGALASTQNTAGTGAVIASRLGAPAAPGGLATQISLADPVNGDGQQADTWGTTTDAIALFSHNEISLTDALTLTVGLRYNRDEKDMSANINSIFQGCNVLQANALNASAVLGYSPNPALPAATQQALGGLATQLLGIMTLVCNPAINTVANGTYSDTQTNEAVTGVVSLAYHVNDDLMIYGGYSRGYKSGGWNVDRSGFNIVPFSTARPSVADLTFDPEFVDALEVGLKSTIFGHTFFNVNVFHEKITDYQGNAFSGFNFITYNAPELISQGVEIDLNSRLTDNLSVMAGVLYDDAYYNETVTVNPLVAADTIPSGTDLSDAPKWSVTGAITYRMPIGSDFSALFYVDARWNDGYTVQTLNPSPLTTNDAYTIVNGRIGFGSNNERWSIELWGRNLTDEYYNIGAFNVPEQTGTIDVYPNEPRSYGVTLRARY